MILKQDEGEFILLDFKTYYERIIIKTLWYHHRDSYINQKNRTVNKKLTYTSIIKWFSTRMPRAWKKMFSSTNSSRTNGYPHA